MASEQEMMSDLATADAAGDHELAQHIAGQIKAARTAAQPQPGIASRALQWLSTPFKSSQPMLDANKANAAGAEPGPFDLTKDSGDTRASLQAVVSGIPGYQRDAETPEAQDRMGRFRTEHKAASILLPLLGGLGKPAALPAAAGPAEAGPITEALTNVARKAGRRTLYGGANGLSERFPVPDSSIDAAAKAGAFKVGGTTEHAANVLSDALDEAGSIKGDVVKEMEAAGIRGPDASSVAQVLRSKAAWLRRNSAGTNLPDIYEKVASDIEGAAGEGGRLGVQQAENIKTSLQRQAKYGRPEETLQNIEKRNIARTLRQGIEDASAADAATIGTPQLQEIRQNIDAIRGGPAPTAPTPGIGANIDVVTPEARAAQDARAAAVSQAAQDANAKLIPAKTAYALLAPAAKAAEKGLSQATKRNAFSLRDTIMAAPMAAAHGAGAGAAMGLLTKAARTYGPSTLAATARGAAGVTGAVSPLVEALVLRGVPQDVAEQLANEMQQGK